MLQKTTSAGDVAALADEPQRRPECRLRARHHRNAVARLERLGDAQGAQAPAGNQQALRSRRLATGLGAERDDVRLALAAGLAEAEQAEALERQHVEALRR